MQIWIMVSYLIRNTKKLVINQISNYESVNYKTDSVWFIKGEIRNFINSC
jgi:hypothetical protein